ncbi:LysM peptidoglycan-binding domain-containing protein [Halalkalibacterium halodurans]|uniref:LysM peptidoglycan-binding domain-containing protein n=1 Tax=Halalkalibacterium halodurans TaxID=86665 RepID=UPI0010FD1DDB|nr:LysM peptidoglycan-binding domain-containing protein [Halalkalibacterium halodurans]MED4080319.1 LysM peptidoglycan-binding domain-containing protein [Halalkalibacterium halodurans]MED4084617.1 LysM peptidoglycan-binding domain-containing protein [Halalkalibacterium halodurans]MED4104819.1 LysM peptidoglycan-binding domain-containing protein [Halalkalibacterium halodurans]MED4109740.1 LysM peptidoglycan-binding domain-containing protein [Halalkalibacterium halodurans]MED4147915.1 LysM pepti
MPVVRQSHVVYTVQPGDTLSAIAARFGSTVLEIQRANLQDPRFIDPNVIFPGWTLVIPVPTVRPFDTTYLPVPGDTLFRISQRFSAHFDLIAGVNRLQDPNLIFVGQLLWVPAFVYEIEVGDTLFGISRRFQIPITKILAANEGRPGFSLDFIFVGFRLLLPLPSSRNIVVTHPFPGDIMPSRELVEGFARVFEANVLMQIRDDNGVIVSAERFTTALEGPPAYGYFSGTVLIDRPPTSPSGQLWVYSRSPVDGSIIDLVQVRVYFM